MQIEGPRETIETNTKIVSIAVYGPKRSSHMVVASKAQTLKLFQIITQTGNCMHSDKLKTMLHQRTKHRKECFIS